MLSNGQKIKVAVAGAGFLSPLLPWLCPLPPESDPIKENTLKLINPGRLDMKGPGSDINVTRGVCKGEWV